MHTLHIAVGSRRGPKVNAVREALETLSPFFAGAQFEVVPVEVQSGVGHTPVSCEELMRGARQRAEALVEVAEQRGASWPYLVGLEGGLEVLPERLSLDKSLACPEPARCSKRRVFLESWAYVFDGTRGHYGRSGGIEIPEALAHEVLDGGVELATAIDRFAGARGIRDAQGAWGVLSSNLISRQEAFRVAVIAAFAPFYNRVMYRPPAWGAAGSQS